MLGSDPKANRDKAGEVGIVFPPKVRTGIYAENRYAGEPDAPKARRCELISHLSRKNSVRYIISRGAIKTSAMKDDEGHRNERGVGGVSSPSASASPSQGLTAVEFEEGDGLFHASSCL